MKKLISSIMLALIALVAQAQILTPVKWKIKLDDKGGAPEKEIVFTATADKGWHLYDMNLPEGGPVSRECCRGECYPFFENTQSPNNQKVMLGILFKPLNSNNL